MQTIGLERNRQSLTDGFLLVRNTFLNLFGQGVPLLVALVTIPFLVAGLGTERFGMLGLLWTVVGYSSLFDLGLGRATTKFVADRLAHNETGALSYLVWTSWLMLLGLGTLGGLVLAAVTPVLVHSVLKVPALLVDETLAALFILSISVPVVLLTAGTRGVLEAQQRFDLINAVQIPSGILNYVLPLVVLAFTSSLTAIAAVLLFSRVAVGAIFLYLCLYKTMPVLRVDGRKGLNIGELKILLSFGGWLTVSNLISPIMVYMDRFIIGAFVSLSAVAYYVIPYTMVTKLQIIPGSLMKVLFPAFSTLKAQDGGVGLLYRRAIKYVFLSMGTLTIALAVLANDVMLVWLGSEFVDHSVLVLTWLALGVLVNSLAQVPFALVQASGRPDITAKFHLLELVPYICLMFVLIQSYGIVGAAVAWTIRVTVDAVLLFWFANRLLPKGEQNLRFILFLVLLGVGFYIISLAVCSLFSGPFLRGGAMALMIFCAGVAVWLFWVDPTERAIIGRGYQRIRRILVTG